MISLKIETKLNAGQVLSVNGDIAEGSIIKIYGPSGAGKTTLLKIIAGLIQPNKGFIKVDGSVWLDTDKQISLSPQQRKTGFVFQNYALFPNMTVQQHLQYATKDEAWINMLLKIGRLEELSHRKPDHLSGGQQQRLAILRALAIKPKVLLMDEPFSALDPKMKSELIEELKSIFKQLACTVFIVSHNPLELEGWADREIYIG